MFVANFTDARVYYAQVTEANAHLLATAYEARTDKELPVLRRFFSSERVQAQKAKFLDVILYSREQIRKENLAMGNVDRNEDVEEYEWGIISIKAQDIDQEIPMEPITAMRNALGKEEGGSGIPLNREEYMKSVEFWKDHAMIY